VSTADRPRYLLVLEAMPVEAGQPDGDARLAICLKDLGRRYRLRCVDCRDVPPLAEVVVKEKERLPCERCGHSILRHSACGVGACLDCDCDGWTEPKEEDREA
jgi:hypothetical protein